MANQVAEDLSEGIRKVAAQARTEEDLRIGVENLLKPALVELGIQSSPRYEKGYKQQGSVLSGRADAVYGHVVIEYERVGALGTKAGVRHTEEQLDQYISAEAGPGAAPDSLRRIVGIGLDGEKIFFRRYSKSAQAGAALGQPWLPGLAPAATAGFSTQGPYPVSASTLESLFVYLRALRRLPMAPDLLVREFGPSGAHAQGLVSAFYKTLRASTSPKVKTFFAEWNRLFGIVYGESLSKAEQEAQALARVYGLPGKIELKRLLFAVHTYYALLMKLLAAELLSLQEGAMVASTAETLASLPPSDMVRQLEDIENGGLFSRLGVRNFLEGDFFGWYLSEWNSEIEKHTRGLARSLGTFEPATGTLEPQTTRDLLKRLYQYLVTPRLRHDLGEYYTPDWLADITLDDSGYDGDPTMRVLDPACGSGTFLVLAIARAREFAEEHLLDPRETARLILANIVGFDLNPLAVIAARTNYLLAFGSLVRYVAPLDIPVYLCDSILTPSVQTGAQATFLDDYPIPSTVGEFHVPKSVVSEGKLAVLARLLEESVAGKYKPKEFLLRVRRELRDTPAADEPVLESLYDKLLELSRQGRNGIWARILRNAFAPVFAGRFDYVVGNPPWVNWENLSGDYRRATRILWHGYGLFSLVGHAARLGGSKKDISMLMLYAAADNYLKADGRLAFVINQSIFKSKGAGDGFRRFRLGDREYLEVLKVQDFSQLRPFEGASGAIGTVVSMRKGRSTSYPVPYVLWRKTGRGGATGEVTLEQVKRIVTLEDQSATPINSANLASPWLTSPRSLVGTLGAVIGPSGYRAHAGVSTWLNGVFWLRILQKRADGLLVVENLNEEGIEDVRLVQAVIEPDLVYPLIRGRDIARFRGQPSAYMLVCQDPAERRGFDELWMKTELPNTYAYLQQFEDRLRARSGMKKYFAPGDPFYSQYNVAEYTFAPYRVMWRQMIPQVNACLTSSVADPWLGNKLTVTQHVVTLVPFMDLREAEYFCALMNSSFITLVSKSYSTGKSFGTPTLLDYVAIPRFDGSEPVHVRLADLTGEAVAEVSSSGAITDRIQTSIDQCAAELWGLGVSDAAAARAAVARTRATQTRLL